MQSVNTADGQVVSAAADALSAMASCLSDYSDAVWDLTGCIVRQHPPAADVKACRQRLCHISAILSELEVAVAQHS